MRWFAKKIFDSKAKDFKNPIKSNSCFCKIIKNLKYLTQKLSTFLVSRREKELSKGSVLIEFAVCMPVLILLLFYIYDLMKIKRLYSQTEFVGQQMANILQNIAKTKVITSDDIKHAASLAYLTIYPGTTMYSKNNVSTCHELFHMPRVYMFRVEGESNEKASSRWGCWINTMTTRTDRWGYGSLTGNGQCVTRWRTNADPSAIYPTLKVEEGKSKIILEAQISWRDTYQNPIGKTVSSAREAFGLRLVNPKEYITYAYFPSVIIFAPNSGFPKDAPENN